MMVETIDASAAGTLSVSQSVVALRIAHPTARILTEQVAADEEHALFRCTIALAGGATGTGYGHETRGTTPDFYEIAEWRAMERACAVLGYAINGLVFDNSVWPTMIVGNGPPSLWSLIVPWSAPPPFAAVAPACVESDTTRCPSR